MLRALLFPLLIAFALVGCQAGPTPSSSEEVTAERTDPARLPEWVLVVPVELEGRSIFVGGCSMALSAAEGTASARDDALLQITSQARSQFVDVFALAPRQSGVSTTSMDRLDFREMGLARFPEAVVDAARIDRVFLRSCTTGASYEFAGGEDLHGVEGRVCQVFVRVSVDSDVWRRGLEETLTDMRHEFRGSGRDNLAELADWIVAHLGEMLGRGEGSGDGRAADR